MLWAGNAAEKEEQRKGEGAPKLQPSPLLPGKAWGNVYYCVSNLLRLGRRRGGAPYKYPSPGHREEVNE